jgi:hypothetical protein
MDAHESGLSEREGLLREGIALMQTETMALSRRFVHPASLYLSRFISYHLSISLCLIGSIFLFLWHNPNPLLNCLAPQGG